MLDNLEIQQIINFIQTKTQIAFKLLENFQHI